MVFRSLNAGVIVLCQLGRLCYKPRKNQAADTPIVLLEKKMLMLSYILDVNLL